MWVVRLFGISNAPLVPQRVLYCRLDFIKAVDYPIKTAVYQLPRFSCENRGNFLNIAVEYDFGIAAFEQPPCKHTQNFSYDTAIFANRSSPFTAPPYLPNSFARGETRAEKSAMLALSPSTSNCDTVSSALCISSSAPSTLVSAEAIAFLPCSVSSFML